jgi:tRNA A-37 threonylcarbamoyl transferase component Bud32/tetratricopeptide (TPR) repeat protein
MIGRTIGSYRILEKIGGGGMGVVYKAHDQKLDRTVALKFLPEQLMESSARERFVREARAASALDHPNVCTIYDIDETEDGRMYIAMGYCAGAPLDARIAVGPLPVDTCVEIVSQTASGLAAAHTAGIIHRDVKPANIIVSDDDAVKIVDFGLAKLSTDTALTREGTAVGTVAYMSPEQARGRDIDHRTDVWSLGTVFYEMLTGKRAFGAEHDSAQLYLIINADPEPVRALRPEVPEAITEIVHRMLQKDPGARFASMDEVSAALQATRAGRAPEGGPNDDVVRARAAFDRCEWRDAFDAFRSADLSKLGPDDLERMGHTAFWTNETETMFDAWERAHAGYVKSGRPTDAARVALELAHYSFGGRRRSVCNGWLKRAETLLKDAPTAVENGYLARQRAQIAIEGDMDLDAALEHVQSAMEFAERHGDADLRAYAIQDRGRALVLKDRVAEGMELLEEAMSLAMAGELSPAVVGSTYCNMISMCQRIADYRRAGEWSESALRWCEPHGESGFPGICAVHRADMMRVRGAWSDAESEAERAIKNGDRRLVLVAAEGFYLKGEVKTRRGEFDEAEECFQEAHQRGRHPVPGLALLRVAQGRVDAARSLIDRALESDAVALKRIRLLPAGVEIALAAGDVDTARARADELQAMASRYESSVYRGQAAHAVGAVALAAGDTSAALGTFNEALSHWKTAEMPYDEARTRALMADAYWRDGADDLAVLEARTARAIFERLGAGADLARIDGAIERNA